MIFKLERADRVSDAFNGIALAVRPVVHGINAPTIARAVMLGVQDSVHDGIPHVEIRRRHVDFGAQGARAVRKLPVLHAREEVQILLDASTPIRTVLPCFGQCAPRLSHLVAAQIANEGFAFLDEVHGPIVELLEVIRCVEEPVAEFAAQPFHILDDRFDVLLLLLGGIGVVEAEVALPRELLGKAEIEHDALGVADVQVAIGFGRKARANTSAMFAAGIVGENTVTNEIRTGGIGVGH